MNDWIVKSCSDAVDALRDVGMHGLAEDMSRILQAGAVKHLSVFRSTEIESIADTLRLAEDSVDIGNCLLKTCLTLGVSHATVHVLEQAEGVTFDPLVVTTYPESWIDCYVERNYAACDPVLAVASARDAAFYWHEIETDDPLTEAFFRDAQEQGVGGAGYTVPLSLWPGARIALTLSSTCAPSALTETLKPFESDIGLLAQEFIEAFSEVTSHQFSRSDSPPASMLTVIRALAHGATLEEASREAGLSGAQSVAEDICAFYDARTVIQAVMRCVELHHLRGVPFTKSDISSASRNSNGLQDAIDSV